MSIPRYIPPPSPPRCSRSHPRLTASSTLLIPNMFQDIALVEQALEDRDNDVSLEVSTGGEGEGVWWRWGGGGGVRIVGEHAGHGGQSQ